MSCSFIPVKLLYKNLALTTQSSSWMTSLRQATRYVTRGSKHLQNWLLMWDGCFS